MAAYTTIDNPELYFQTKLWTGTGSTNALTLDGSEDMQPDLVWIKLRAGAADYGHRIFDSVRGATKPLNSAATSAEGTETNSLTVFGSDGFTVVDADEVNQSGGSYTYVAWNWKAGNSAGSSNTDGTITSTATANTTSGCSIVKWTGTGANGTVGHSMGTAPSFIIVKRYSSSGGGWPVRHPSVTTADVYVVWLHSNSAQSSDAANFNSTAPTSTVFSLGTSNNVNKPSGHDHIGYCFAEKQGYSKFGVYKGNANADGAFVYLGFRPAFFLTKRASATGNWVLWDNKRSPANPVSPWLKPDSTISEDSDVDHLDFCSNGVKFNTTDGAGNGDHTYLYAAFAEAPFVNSEGVPCNAR